MHAIISRIYTPVSHFYHDWVAENQCWTATALLKGLEIEFLSPSECQKRLLPMGHSIKATLIQASGSMAGATEEERVINFLNQKQPIYSTPAEDILRTLARFVYALAACFFAAPAGVVYHGIKAVYLGGCYGYRKLTHQPTNTLGQNCWEHAKDCLCDLLVFSSARSCRWVITTGMTPDVSTIAALTNGIASLLMGVIVYQYGCHLKITASLALSDRRSQLFKSFLLWQKFGIKSSLNKLLQSRDPEDLEIYNPSNPKASSGQFFEIAKFSYSPDASDAAALQNWKFFAISRDCMLDHALIPSLRHQIATFAPDQAFGP